ncbi:2OG-Fe dioxygenase family protein [Streptomyces monticola]|uniref:2OG-Fe dioxygenase family protein n=1 Tax=Streptomyces monticola TaxID=2666263 RepID=A0ABW2JSU3_9ACTN
MNQDLWAKELDEHLYARGRVTELIGREVAGTPEWEDFRESWSRLPVDAFMAHGETYRLRRHSVFNVRADGTVEGQPSRPYLQTTDINHLNGGVRRSYAPIEEPIVSGRLFTDLLKGITAVLTAVHGPDVWHHQCFQNRITTDRRQTGNPTPEGIHRDGVDYVVTLLIDRHHIDGGRTGIYDAVSRRQLHSETLLRPGDMVIADDERTLHDATPITPADSSASGHRDVFIDVITRGTAPR